MQVQVAAISVRVTGDMAGLFMTQWDRETKQALEEHSVETKLDRRYVEDTNIIVKTLSNSQTAENERIMMGSIQHIANSLHQSIRVTMRYPTRQINKRLLVLDTDKLD